MGGLLMHLELGEQGCDKPAIASTTLVPVVMENVLERIAPCRVLTLSSKLGKVPHARGRRARPQGSHQKRRRPYSSTTQCRIPDKIGVLSTVSP